jgi:hypothetical protein
MFPFWQLYIMQERKGQKNDTNFIKVASSISFDSHIFFLSLSERYIISATFGTPQ